MSEVSVVVDGNNSLWRSFHVFTGVVGASYGFLKQLRYHLKRFEADKCYICWDGRKASAARREMYPEYKAGRDKDNVDYQMFYNQYPFLRKLLTLTGIIQVEHEEAEADDTMSSLVHFGIKERKAGREFVVITSDRDLLPLVQPGVSVFQPVKDQLVGFDNFEKLFGLSPFQYFQYRLLSGDSSDNIKGVTGIVGAKWILQTFGSLEGFFAAMEKFRTDPEGRIWVWDINVNREEVRKKLRWKKFQAIMEEDKLDILDRNIDLMSPKIEKPRLEQGRLEEDALQRIFMKAGFGSLLNGFKSWLKPFRELKIG